MATVGIKGLIYNRTAAILAFLITHKPLYRAALVQQMSKMENLVRSHVEVPIITTVTKQYIIDINTVNTLKNNRKGQRTQLHTWKLSL